MLRLVGHPVAVNPDAELARVARAEGWQILRFERLGRRLRVAVAAVALGGHRVGRAAEVARVSRADRRAGGDPRARAAVRRREDRAARRRVGPRAHVPARAVRRARRARADGRVRAGGGGRRGRRLPLLHPRPRGALARGRRRRRDRRRAHERLHAAAAGPRLAVRARAGGGGGDRRVRADRGGLRLRRVRDAHPGGRRPDHRRQAVDHQRLVRLDVHRLRPRGRRASARSSCAPARTASRSPARRRRWA